MYIWLLTTTLYCPQAICKLQGKEITLRIWKDKLTWSRWKLSNIFHRLVISIITEHVHVLQSLLLAACKSTIGIRILELHRDLAKAWANQLMTLSPYNDVPLYHRSIIFTRYIHIMSECGCVKFVVSLAKLGEGMVLVKLYSWTICQCSCALWSLKLS